MSNKGKEVVPEADFPAGDGWIAIINTKSGGQKGKEVLAQFVRQKLLPEDQVFGLIPEGPEAAIQKWAEDPERYKLIVCGGDGTVGWVLSVAEKAGVSTAPQIAVIPLGTGNDLARVFGWGGGYNGGDLRELMQTLAKASVLALDRWLVDVQPLQELDKATNAKLAQVESSGGGGGGGGDTDEHVSEEEEEEEEHPKLEDQVDIDKLIADGPKPVTHIMNNYFSLGVDAEIALSFHKMREAKTSLFQSQLVNKGWYGALGVKTALVPRRAICCYALLEVDGREIQIPRKILGILLLNMPSYGGGTQPWGNKKESQYKEPAINDGMIEVIGLKGALHLARIQTRTSVGKGIRLAQGKSVKITVSRPIPAQVDGEPWLMPIGEVRITHHSQAQLLYNVTAKGAEEKKLQLHGLTADA